MKSLSPDKLLGRPLNKAERKNAPSLLYVEGPMDIPLRHPLVSIIGTRKPTRQGMEEAREVTKTLVREKVTVVSGLAAGIDSIAHRTTIEMRGKTVAVLGTSLDRIYPRQNLDLQKEITAKHLAVSQFPVGHPTTRGNFVRRNKTMALISDATVIVEAGEISGTIHQGRETLRLGKPLFICSAVARAGPRWLDEMKRYGATVLSDYRDVLYNIPRGMQRVDTF